MHQSLISVTSSFYVLNIYLEYLPEYVKEKVIKGMSTEKRGIFLAPFWGLR